MESALALRAPISAEVVRDAISGDSSALTLIVAAHHNDMARVAYVVCGDIDLAQDAAQSAWDKAWRRLGTLRDPGRLRPWLLAVAANEARQLARQRRRDQVVPIELADIGSDHSDPGARPDVADLARALELLGPGDRAIIALRYEAGFDSAEIGRALGISSAGARTRLKRAVARLREELRRE